MVSSNIELFLNISDMSFTCVELCHLLLLWNLFELLFPLNGTFTRERTDLSMKLKIKCNRQQYLLLLYKYITSQDCIIN